MPLVAVVMVAVVVGQGRRQTDHRRPGQNSGRRIASVVVRTAAVAEIPVHPVDGGVAAVRSGDLDAIAAAPPIAPLAVSALLSADKDIAAVLHLALGLSGASADQVTQIGRRLGGCGNRGPQQGDAGHCGDGYLERRHESSLRIEGR